MNKPSTSQDAGATASTRLTIRSTELLRFGQPLQIEHRGSLYTLRETRNGKLILTK